MKIKSFCKLTNFFTKLCIKYNNTLSLNKNLLISGIIGFIISLIVSDISAKYSNNNFANSALTVIMGFIFAKLIFIILFHHDNKHKYTKKMTGKLNIYYLKQIALLHNYEFRFLLIESLLL